MLRYLAFISPCIVLPGERNDCLHHVRCIGPLARLEHMSSNFLLPPYSHILHHYCRSILVVQFVWIYVPTGPSTWLVISDLFEFVTKKVWGNIILIHFQKRVSQCLRLLRKKRRCVKGRLFSYNNALTVEAYIRCTQNHNTPSPLFTCRSMVPNILRVISLGA
jgi:hypothetical protein